jgi:hypothetical protein
LCLRPAILPLSMLSLNPIREYSHASNAQWKFFSCKDNALFSDVFGGAASMHSDPKTIGRRG